ncbi:hypothetical protein KC316_g2523 [Hortaea werneckii]|nr:hypothetical protein KC324_g2188 [Hortaea werneckii]KAI7592048.1 hypothetical protein KC316_g2523 [Hortaea werneckii]
MSSSLTPFKRVASGGDTGDQKAIDDNDVFDFLSGNNDKHEDMGTVAPADEEVVETTETNTEGPEQTPELDVKLLKVIKQVRDREERINRKKKETEELRARTAILTCVTKNFVKHMDMAEKIVQRHGGEFSEKEAQRLKAIKRFLNGDMLTVLARELNDPIFTSLVQQALPDKAVPSLRPFRSNRRPHTEGGDNNDDSSNGHEAVDEDGTFSSSGHGDCEAAVELEEERSHEFERPQEPGHRAGTSDPGNEHQDALLAYIERQRYKLSKSAHRR